MWFCDRGIYESWQSTVEEYCETDRQWKTNLFSNIDFFFYHQQNQDPNQIHFVSNHDNIELSIISPQVLPSFSSILLQFSTFYTVATLCRMWITYLKMIYFLYLFSILQRSIIHAIFFWRFVWILLLKVSLFFYCERIVLH